MIMVTSIGPAVAALPAAAAALEPEPPKPEAEPEPEPELERAGARTSRSQGWSRSTDAGLAPSDK